MYQKANDLPVKIYGLKFMILVAKIDDRILLVKSSLSKKILFFNLKDRNELYTFTIQG